MNGWICPKCGKVYAPDVKECAACNAVVTYPVYPVYPYYPAVMPSYPYLVITCKGNTTVMEKGT